MLCIGYAKSAPDEGVDKPALTFSFVKHDQGLRTQGVRKPLFIPHQVRAALPIPRRSRTGKGSPSVSQFGH
jgi:hypothetical protein